MSDQKAHAPDITMEMLYDLFDVSAEEGPGRLVHIARQAHYTLPSLVLSVLERDGAVMGPAAAGELARARRRSAHYGDVLASLPSDLSFTVLKGLSLAAAYPPGVLRPQGDIDLLVPDEAELWRTVSALSAEEPTKTWVTVVGHGRHLLVTLVWPPEEPLLDPEHRVELSTAGLLGDFGAVPIRVHPPRDRALAHLVCLAEERLQRPFHPRDALDLYAMSGQDLPPLAEIVAAAESLRLAPELAELIRYASDLLPIDRLAPLLSVLEPAAETERNLRAGHVPVPGTADTRKALLQGVPVHGIHLGRIEEGDKWPVSRMHRYGEEVLLLTPVGAYLLVSDAVVSRERHAAATEEFNRLARGNFDSLQEDISAAAVRA